MQAIHKDERMLRKCDPLEKIVQTFQHMEMMDSPGPITLSNDVEVAQQLRKDRLESGATESFNGVERKPEDILSESDLRAALRAAEKQIEEQKSTNLLLTEKLEYGSRYLSKLRAEHAEEVARRNQSINYAQQLNFELTADISQTETSLAEIKSRYKTLVSNLEQQLEEARTEVNVSLSRHIGSHIGILPFSMCASLRFPVCSSLPSQSLPCECFTLKALMV